MVRGLLIFATIDHNFKQDFQDWLLFWVPCSDFWKTWVRFPDAEFDTESIYTDLRYQKLRGKKLVCPFLSALFYFETNLIK